MKNFRENTIALFKITAVIFSALFCLTETDCVKEAVTTAVTRCLTVIIPSLYAMLIVSGIIIGSGIFEKAPKLLAIPGKYLLKMEPDIFFIFSLSQFAGYPVGAKMLSSAAENGRISGRRAELLTGVCYGAGPAFIFGCISSQLYSSSSAGKLILISSVAANLSLALILSVTSEKNSTAPQQKKNLNLSEQMLTDSIVSAGRSMAVICFSITAFSVISSLLTETGITGQAAQLLAKTGLISPENAKGIICAILDVTSVSELPHNNYRLLPVISGLASFGGVCVIFQISAVCPKNFSVKPMILLRTAAALVSGIICRIIMPFFISGETVSAADTNISVHSTANPLPSIILIIMTFIVFSEIEKLRKAAALCDK